MEAKQQVKETVEAYVCTKLANRNPIENIREVYEAVNAKLGTDLKYAICRNIMKYHLGLKYKQLQYGSPEANVQRCLVLRQQFAIKLLRLMSEGKRIYNIDES